MEFEFRGDILPNDYAEIMRYYGYNDNVCPGDVRQLLDEAGGDEITLHIDSDGGSLIAGTEIYSLLRAYSGKKTAHIRSRAASSATVSIMACDVITADPPSLICVHNPTTYASGDAGEMRRNAETLDGVKDAIISAYSSRVRSTEEIAELMNRDIWIDAWSALEYGLIDKIEGEEGAQASRRGTIINFTSARDIFPSEKMISDYRSVREEQARKRARHEIHRI